MQIPSYGFFLKPHDVLTINATSATSGRLLSLLQFLPFFHKLKLPTLSVFRFVVTRFVHIYIGACTTALTRFAFHIT